MRSPLAPLAPVLGVPVEALWINANLPLVLSPVIGLNVFPSEDYNVLSLVVIDQLQVLKRSDDILLLDACLLRYFTARSK